MNISFFQIQNITANTICLERVELEPNDHYSATPLNHTEDGKPVACSIDRLQPQNSCQFIYSLKPMPSIASDLKTLKLATNIGKLDIVWRSSNMAERGRLQTSQLIRNVSSEGKPQTGIKAIVEPKIEFISFSSLSLSLCIFSLLSMAI